jgi:hypothetical protein
LGFAASGAKTPRFFAPLPSCPLLSSPAPHGARTPTPWPHSARFAVLRRRCRQRLRHVRRWLLRDLAPAKGVSVVPPPPPAPHSCPLRPSLWLRSKAWALVSPLGLGYAVVVAVVCLRGHKRRTHCDAQWWKRGQWAAASSAPAATGPRQRTLGEFMARVAARFSGLSHALGTPSRALPLGLPRTLGGTHNGAYSSSSHHPKRVGSSLSKRTFESLPGSGRLGRPSPRMVAESGSLAQAATRIGRSQPGHAAPWAGGQPLQSK